MQAPLPNGAFHQAMILTHQNAEAISFVNILNQKCQQVHRTWRSNVYVDGTPASVLKDFKECTEYELFLAGSGGSKLDFISLDRLRVLGVCARFLEGFDQKSVNVCVVARSVAESSRVLFAQFVDRGVRKVNAADPITAVVVLTHDDHAQHENFSRLEYVPDDGADLDDVYVRCFSPATAHLELL